MFSKAFDLEQGSLVSLVGAGGKTSLMYQLAEEVREEWKVLVSTTTRILVPGEKIWDDIDLSGNLFQGRIPDSPGLYIGGVEESLPGGPEKIRGVDEDLLRVAKDTFDLVLLEADGAACKPLKGWKASEPVVPGCTTHTIGVVDIQCLGMEITEDIVHRLDLFVDLTGVGIGQKLEIAHLAEVILSTKGLFREAVGEKILYINKVESIKDMANAARLQALCPGIKVISGSLKDCSCYV